MDSERVPGAGAAGVDAPREPDEVGAEGGAWCSVCARVTLVEPVPCADGHGADCPEVICVECGYVAVVGLVLDEMPGGRAQRSPASAA